MTIHVAGETAKGAPVLVRSIASKKGGSIVPNYDPCFIGAFLLLLCFVSTRRRDQTHLPESTKSLMVLFGGFLVMTQALLSIPLVYSPPYDESDDFLYPLFAALNISVAPTIGLFGYECMLKPQVGPPRMKLLYDLLARISDCVLDLFSSLIALVHSLMTLIGSTIWSKLYSKVSSYFPTDDNPSNNVEGDDHAENNDVEGPGENPYAVPPPENGYTDIPLLP